MNGRDCDMAIIGGGLAGGLIALALAQHRPDLSVRLIESGPALGGNHRWSWFVTDLTRAGEALLEPIRKTEWASGYEVAFPSYRRTLATPYRSMASTDFAAALERDLGPRTVMTRCETVAVDANGATLHDGRRIDARCVIDCRGLTAAHHLRGGWQVFMGRLLRLERPHGLDRPTIMDATVEQVGGYRFVYVLPLGTHEVFVEDTYYQDSPRLDCPALSSRLDAYCAEQGWKGTIEGSETGVLPVVTGGNFAAFQRDRRVAGVACAGARGGFIHPLTSYTVPFAVEVALAVARKADHSGARLAAMLERRARRHWRRTAHYRMLGTLLFGAARPEERYRVFERFYRLPEPLIDRFYAGHSTLADRLRTVTGRPPVSMLRAFGALATSRPRLEWTRQGETS